MQLGRCLAAIGAIMAAGMLQVFQRNTLYLRGYALGDRVEQTHKEETEVSWLETHILRLTSPDHLYGAAQERHLNLVAWSVLTPNQIDSLADSMDSSAAHPAGSPPHHPPPESMQLADGRDTTD